VKAVTAQSRCWIRKNSEDNNRHTYRRSRLHKPTCAPVWSHDLSMSTHQEQAIGTPMDRFFTTMQAIPEELDFWIEKRDVSSLARTSNEPNIGPLNNLR
jgi:hypothetical protein